MSKDKPTEPAIVAPSPARLRYVPAGLYPHTFMGDSSLYVKLLPLSSYRLSISYEEIDKNHVILRLYDRDVHIVRNVKHITEEVDFDFHFNNSIFARDNIYYRELGVERVLISAHNGMNELKHVRASGWKPTHPGIKLMGDSGGAQLRMGTTPYIDPKDVISWMNDFVDIGAALDVPHRPADQGNEKLMWGLAEVQRRNNEVYLAQRKRDDLQFLNVVHGFGLEDARKWCAHVHTKDPAFVSWAAGLGNRNSFFSSLLAAMVPMVEYPECGGKNGLHFFGISGKSYIPCFAWMAKRTGVPITMDSTNYLKGNRYRQFCMTDWKGRMTEVEMGRSAKVGYRTELPCSCPVCYSIRWCEAFGLEGGAKMQHMLTIHNLITILKFVQRWNEIAAKSTYEEFRAAVTDAYHVKMTRNGILDSVEFIEDAVEHGLDAAAKKYKDYLWDESSLEDEAPVKMEALFPGEGPRSAREDRPSMVSQQFLDESTRILHRYIPKKEMKLLWEDERRRRRKADKKAKRKEEDDGVEG